MTNAIKGDSRYRVAREWCGYSKPRWVARFCGEWLGQSEHRADALMMCLAHCDKRNRDLAET
jgi:hypothetical protein